MPLTSKGEKIERKLEAEYGAKKGESVLYALKNAGKVTGIDKLKEAAAAGAREAEAQRQTAALLRGDHVSGRDRGKLRR